MTILHPSNRRLQEFADGELGAADRARTSRHLQRCVRCRQTVTGVRTLGRDARKLEWPSPPAHLRMRVLNRASDSAPTILPVADPMVAAPAWRRLAWLGVAGLLGTVGVGSILWPRSLSSEAGDVRIVTRATAGGQELEVTYLATSDFAQVDQVTLRAVFRRDHDLPQDSDRPILNAATLHRDGRRVFRGAVRLPSEVVYARFALEDETGTRLDSHGRRGWEWLATEGGDPTADALMQQAYDASGRDLRVALAAATAASELEPTLLDAWALRSHLEKRVLGPAFRDSLGTVHVPRIELLDSTLRSGAPTALTASNMYYYAVEWDVPAIVAYWRDRIVREWPTSRAGVQTRAIDIFARDVNAPNSGEAELEALWSATKGGQIDVAQVGYALATRRGDALAEARWAYRWLQVDGGLDPTLLRQLSNSSTTRDTILTWLHEQVQLRRGGSETRRPLYRTAPAQERVDARVRQQLLGSIGRVLLAAGEPAAAIPYLDSAVAQGWSAEFFKDALDARLRANVEDGLVEIVARLYVDPALDYRAADSAAAGVDEATWDAEVGRAMERMVAATLDDAQPLALPEHVSLEDIHGQSVDLRSLLRDQLTVVWFWWPQCRTCLSEALRLQEIVRDHAGQPARLIIVSTDVPPASQLEHLSEIGLERLVAVDVVRQAATAFEMWSTTGTFVVDPHGVVQFRYSTAEDLPRQLLVLSKIGSLVS